MAVIRYSKEQFNVRKKSYWLKYGMKPFTQLQKKTAKRERVKHSRVNIKKFIAIYEKGLSIK